MRLVCPDGDPTRTPGYPRDLRQVVAQDPPAHPSPKPPSPWYRHRLNLYFCFNSWIRPSIPARKRYPARIAAPSPGPPVRRRLADVRQRHRLDPRLPPQPLVLRRRHPPVGRQQTRHDPDPVADQAAVGGEGDVALDGRGLDPLLAAAGHLQRPGQLDDAVVEGLEAIVLAQRIRVVSSGTFSRSMRQNWRSTRLSLTKDSACAKHQP